MTTMPEAIAAYLQARAEDGATFTTEEAATQVGYVAVRYVLPILASIGSTPVLLVDEVSRARRRPRIVYRVNPAWAQAQLPGHAPGPALFDRAAAINEARALLGGEVSR